MLFDPSRHEALHDLAWDAERAREAIARIVAETEARFDARHWWPQHPRDADDGADLAQPVPPLYFGAAGVCWALHYLQDQGAVRLQRNYFSLHDDLIARTGAWLADDAQAERASYLMGETPIRLWAYGAHPDPVQAQALQALVEGNIDHPARELMWGSPGTLLAALFLHERTGQAPWADLFRATAQKLWSQLRWSEAHACHYWTQDLYGRESAYIDAVHGFVATASPLIRGRALLAPSQWTAWQDCIANTVVRTATWEDGAANWRAWLEPAPTKPMLMQYCHGAPGFVVCLADFPDPALDDLLLAAGEATWRAGPLNKGSNLCHGTGGNGYAFLKLYRRTGDEQWLHRARAFAMHGIAQTWAEQARHGRLRYSLWTGDPGFAIYLWDCLRGEAAFPTVDVFYGAPPGT